MKGLLRAALIAAALGYGVLRCKPNGKRPDMPHGKDDATTDPNVIRAMFRHPANLGLLPPPGVLVYDFDVPSEAERPAATPEGRVAETWKRIEAVHERAPETRDAPLLVSRSGAPHLVTRMPTGTPAPSCGPFFGPDGERWGDIRGNGQTYVLIAPSVVNGRQYGTVRPLVKPADLPAVTLDQLGMRTDAPTPSKVGGVGPVGVLVEDDAREVANPETYARALLQGAHDRLAAAAPGTRHHTALSEARTLGRWIAGYQRAGVEGLTQADALEALVAACTTNGDMAEDGRATVLKTLRDGLRYGLARPFDITTRKPVSKLEAITVRVGP